MPTIKIANKSVKILADVLVGSDSTCSLHIKHDSIAQRHARIFTNGKTWFIEDLLSAGGTKVNDALITGVTGLKGGDRLQLGSVVMSFLVEDATAGNSSQMIAEYARVWSGKEVAGILVGTLDRIETTGPVFRAKHALTGVEVLFWVVRSEVIALEGDGFFDRFKAATTPLLLPEHPNVIRIFQMGQHQGVVWYTTASPTGTSLTEMLARGFSPHAAIETVLGLCRLLAVMHQAAIIHGELRPSLVHIDKDSQVRLGSIGLTGLSSSTCKALQLRADSLQGKYLDAEQAETGNRNVKSDLYSIGCMLVEMIIGKPPFTGDTPDSLRKAHAEGPIPRLASGSNLPPELDSVIQGLLCKSHLRRFDDFDTVIVALERLLNQPADKSAGASSEVPQDAEKASAPLLKWVVIGAVAATLLIGGFLLYRSATEPHLPIYDLPIPTAPTLGEQDLPAVQKSNAAIESAYPLRQSGWTACRALYENGKAVLITDKTLSVSDKVHAVPAGRIFITRDDPPRFIARDSVANPSDLPPDIIDCQLLMHVDDKVIARLKAAKEQREKSERESKAEQARLAEAERVQAEAARSQSDAEKARLALEQEAKTAKAAEAVREAARKELQLKKDEEDKATNDLVARSKVLAGTITQLASEMETASTIDGKPMDRFTVPRTYADDIKPLLDKADVVTDFTEQHTAKAAAITGHADYKRLQTAVKTAQELSKVAIAKLEKFKEAAIESRARAERERVEQDANAERIRANRAAEQARREAAARQPGATDRTQPQQPNQAPVQRRYNTAFKYWERWDTTMQQWVPDSR